MHGHSELSSFNAACTDIVNFHHSMLHAHTCTKCLWQIRNVRNLSAVYRLMDCAKDMIREALPIKCLEAVILGMYPFFRIH